MTSKISTNKLSLWSLMREDLRHRTWMIALSALGSFLACPVAFLFFIDTNRRRYLYATTRAGVPLTKFQISEALANEIAEYLTSTHLVMQMTILMLGAVIVAVFGFRYLYSRRMVDLCHSLPVTRGRLFLTYWLNGLLIWLVPFLAGNLCVYLLAMAQVGEPACFGVFTAAMAKLIPFCLLCFLIAYNGCLVAVTVSGNATNALVNLLLYGLIVMGGNFTFLLYMEKYFRTFVEHSDFFLRPVIVALSPLASPVCLALYFGNGHPLSEWLPLLLLSAALMAVNFCLALWLHWKRPSELAERGLEARWFRIPMRFAVSFLSGMLLAMLFDNITGRGAWCLFGAVFGSVFTFAVTNILYHGGFKYLFRHKLQLAISLLLTCGVIGIFRFDAFGYDSYVPNVADIRGCSIGSYVLHSGGYGLQKAPDGSYYYKMDIPSEEYLFTDAEAIHKLLEVLVTPTPGYNGSSSTLIIRVDTVRGSYDRQYYIYDTAEHREALRPLVENDSFRECYYPASGEDWELPNSININTLDNIVVTIEGAERIRQLHEAFRKDFLEHYSLEHASLRFTPLNLDYSYKPYQTASLRITEDYAATLALLKEWYPDFFWTPDDLILNALNIEFHSDDTDPDALYRYFGLAEADVRDLSPGESPAAAETISVLEYGPTAETIPMDNYWTKRISDPEELAAWRPYLILGRTDCFFSDRDDIYIGTVSFTRSLGDYEQEISCYVKPGALPRELLEDLVDTKKQYD